MKRIADAIKASGAATGDVVRELERALGVLSSGSGSIEFSAEASKRLGAAERIIWEMRHRNQALSLRVAVALVLAQGHQIMRRPDERRAIWGPCATCKAARGARCRSSGGLPLKRPHKGRQEETPYLGLGSLIQSDASGGMSGASVNLVRAVRATKGK